MKYNLWQEYNKQFLYFSFSLSNMKCMNHLFENTFSTEIMFDELTQLFSMNKEIVDSF